ncbi:hypothetical protein X975_13329, partial [Stegodyphus mimosarum]
MRTGIWQLLPKETGEAQPQTCLVSSLQPLVRQFQETVYFPTSPGLACSLILAGLSYGELQVPVTTKKTSLSDSVAVVQECSFGVELFWVPELTCMFKLEPWQAKSIGTSFWNNTYVCFGAPWAHNLCLWITTPVLTVQTS